jgi:hypothetical protein
VSLLRKRDGGARLRGAGARRTAGQRAAAQRVRLDAAATCCARRRAAAGAGAGWRPRVFSMSPKSAA